MSKDVRTKARQSQKLVEEVTALELPEPSPEPALDDDARLDGSDHDEADLDDDTPLSREIRARMAQIDMSSTQSIVGFGAAAQGELQQISQAMLSDVRNKDAGPAGDSLREIVSTLRGFAVSELDVRRDRTLWERVTGSAAPLARFTARFEGLQSQIDRITDDLLGHEHRLLKDIKALDLLYEKTLGFYDELGLYIAAGTRRLRQLDTQEIPALERAMQDAADRGEGAQMQAAQALRDLRGARDDLERRVHDLKLTRQVTMQSLPSIRLVQENDKTLVTRINSTLVNTVPLWESQLAQTITLRRSAEAAGAVRAANDLTNDLLRGNAAQLRQTNRAIRQENERGVFDIEAVKQANDDLIAAIRDSLSIADQGKARRAAAEADLQKMEAELRDTLARARDHATGLDGRTAQSIPEPSRKVR
ncbi:toxic anion resistance protein [Pseudooceanicola sediminis]|uniref:Toxic anion resistance protein n=1 Tax=Pseudooceanicola sediminis TaxID=2211117 RepID=A0A399IUQ5_9RHOB|nr:toxic anion resistance protein [Pseudooceanicola sediminis]RII36865.1 toxic anion resistance protein [Pseudooceanicola sediminis]|tara:strand:+ start:126315 stop:127574 length:1260 start_codon:yes stop_codon:yes gene_type:complete